MEKKKIEFSKRLLIQESGLIWIMSLAFLGLAYYCIYKQYLGTLPWLAAMVGFPWTAYGVSQVFYYKKSLAENTVGGIKYDSVIKELDKAETHYEETSKENFSNAVNSVDSSFYQEDFTTDPTYSENEYQI